jgi:multidrug resistance protein, MATE family
MEGLKNTHDVTLFSRETV